MTGMGKDSSCMFRGLMGLESIFSHRGESASYVFAIITQIFGEKQLVTPSKPTATPDPPPRGVFPGVNHGGVCLPSRVGREELFQEKVPGCLVQGRR